MRHRDPLEDEVRALLRDAHRPDPETPSFSRMWGLADAAAQSVSRRRAWIPILAAALTLTAAMVWIGTFRAARQAVDVEFLVASIRGSDATPLDFLLDTPGVSFLYRTPRFNDPTPTIDLSLFQLPEE